MKFHHLITIFILVTFFFTQVLPLPVFAQNWDPFASPDPSAISTITLLEEVVPRFVSAPPAGIQASSLSSAAQVNLRTFLGLSGRWSKGDVIKLVELEPKISSFFDTNPTPLQKVQALQVLLKVKSLSPGIASLISSQIQALGIEFSSSASNTLLPKGRTPPNIAAATSEQDALASLRKYFLQETLLMKEVEALSYFKTKKIPQLYLSRMGLLATGQELREVVIKESMPLSLVQRIKNFKEIATASEYQGIIDSPAGVTPAALQTLKEFKTRLNALLPKSAQMADADFANVIKLSQALERANSALGGFLKFMVETEKNAWKASRNLKPLFRRLVGLLTKDELAAFETTKAIPGEFAKVKALQTLTVEPKALETALKTFQETGEIPSGIQDLLKKILTPEQQASFLKEGKLPLNLIQDAVKGSVEKVSTAKLWPQIRQALGFSENSPEIGALIKYLGESKISPKLLLNFLNASLSGEIDGAHPLVAALRAINAERMASIAAAPAASSAEALVEATKQAGEPAGRWNKFKGAVGRVGGLCSKYPKLAGGLGGVLISWLDAAAAGLYMRGTTGTWTYAVSELENRVSGRTLLPPVPNVVIVAGGGVFLTWLISNVEKKLAEKIVTRYVAKQAALGVAKEGAERLGKELAKKIIGRVNIGLLVLTLGLMAFDISRIVNNAQQKLVELKNGATQGGGTVSFDGMMKQAIEADKARKASPGGQGGEGSYLNIPKVYAAAAKEKEGVVGNNFPTAKAVLLCILENESISVQDIKKVFAGAKDSIVPEDEEQKKEFFNCVEEVALEERDEQRDQFISELVKGTQSLHTGLDSQLRALKALKVDEKEAILLKNASEQWKNYKIAQGVKELRAALYQQYGVEYQNAGEGRESLIKVLSDNQTWMGLQAERQAITPQAWQFLSEHSADTAIPFSWLWDHLGPWGKMQKSREIDRIISKEAGAYAQRRFFSQEALRQQQQYLLSVPLKIQSTQDSYARAAEKFVFEDGYYLAGLTLKKQLEDLEAQRGNLSDPTQKTAVIRDAMISTMDNIENKLRALKMRLKPEDPVIPEGYLKNLLFLGDDGIERFFIVLKDIAAILTSRAGISDSAKIIFNQGEETYNKECEEAPMLTPVSGLQKVSESEKLSGYVATEKIQEDKEENIPAGLLVLGLISASDPEIKEKANSLNLLFPSSLPGQAAARSLPLKLLSQYAETLPVGTETLSFLKCELLEEQRVAVCKQDKILKEEAALFYIFIPGKTLVLEPPTSLEVKAFSSKGEKLGEGSVNIVSLSE